MFVDDLDLPAGKIGEAAHRVIDRAAMESRRRGHVQLTSEHLFLALAQVEWNLFAEVMRGVDLNPQAIVIGVEEALAALPSADGRDVRVAPDTRLLARLALHRATIADNPYTVVLLDEVEKANPSVLNLFLQAFDEGWLTDGRGKRVYLSDAIVIMTSNVGSEYFRKLRNPLGFLSGDVAIEQVQADVRREMERRFSPEFLNRIDDVVLFSPLTHDEARDIARHYLSTVVATLAKAGKTFEIDDDALALLVSEGYNAAYGARFLKRTIDERVKLPISMQWRDASHFQVTQEGGAVVVVPTALRVVHAETAVA